MIDISAIKETEYFTSLNEADQKTLIETFEKWPENLREEFVKNILQMAKENDPVQILTGLEAVMKNMKESAVVARREEEQAQKNEEKDEAEILLGQY